jgi:hypothetical protein
MTLAGGIGRIVGAERGSGGMTKIESWPLWLQQLVVIPHAAVLFWLLLRNPKTRRGWYFVYGFMAYMAVVYYFFLR